MKRQHLARLLLVLFYVATSLPLLALEEAMTGKLPPLGKIGISYKEEKGKPGVVDAGKDAVKLRAKADEDSAVLERVSDGTPVLIIEKKGDWRKVIVNGKQGFIRAEKVKPRDKDKDNGGFPVEGGDFGKNTTAPFKSGLKGYTAFRTPTLIVTKKGTVLAFCQGRVDSHADEGDIDIVLRRSPDGGKTWEDLQVLENDGKNPCKTGAAVLLPSGRVMLMWLWNEFIAKETERTTRKILVTWSDDEGKTWSKSRDITSSVYGKNWGWYGVGPGHGIVKTREPHKGRIIMPARHNSSGSHTVAHFLYSDDGGETWRIGGSTNLRSSETTVVELSDGQLMLNSRNQDDTSVARIVSLSRDGGASVYRAYVDDKLVEPKGCQGSLLNHSFNQKTGKSNILFSNPHDEKERTNGTLQLSEDDGQTWTKKVRYSDEPPTFSGYSDIALINGADIGILFEKGGKPTDRKADRYDEIDFRIVPFAALSGETAKEEPKAADEPAKASPDKTPEKVKSVDDAF